MMGTLWECWGNKGECGWNWVTGLHFLHTSPLLDWNDCIIYSPMDIAEPSYAFLCILKQSVLFHVLLYLSLDFYANQFHKVRPPYIQHHLWREGVYMQTLTVNTLTYPYTMHITLRHPESHTETHTHVGDTETARERERETRRASLPTFSFIIYLLSAVFPSHAYWCGESRVWVCVRIISWRGRQGGSNQQSTDAIWQPLEPLVHS